MKNVRFLLIATGVFFVGIAAVFLTMQLIDRSRQFRGSAIEPSPSAVDFHLTDTTGASFQLSEQRGKVVLLFFGYANCPDYCPTTLAEYKNIHEKLGDRTENVRFVFVTVDPDRDSPLAIDQFVHAFNPSFIGLTGTPEELDLVWSAYWVGRSTQSVDSELGYLVAHATRIYVVDKAGRLRLTFPFGMAPSDMAHDIDLLLAEE